MITDDRRDLNDRFKEVFRILEERGEIIKNDRNGRGLGDFAKRILSNRSYGHIVRAFLNDDDKRCINYEQARRVCHEYNVNQSYLLEGEGTPFGMELPEPVEVAGSDIPLNIMFTTTEAFAGATIDSDSFVTESTDFFRLPGISGSGYVAFPIKGNSMEPIINNGDIVICKEIEGIQQIKENRIYAVRSNGKIWIKYVQKVSDSKGRIIGLKLISANYLEHDPWIEEVEISTKLYEVVRRVCDI
ncbi:helix-turn-helix transcriptional regulator [Neolewinella lacunae]|uniref:Helix-turn-helix transcriptional regulator n=1 Tax=Neolewinella lacunae TaxID=1517758 RepID=A0A923PG32_9BACT|nr:helix-turn-helix transcriptional regulator [Neolewinella lacunae]MBC6993422.1 helix-turn-helix transcriptional regulator [Neolewinella lacunae]MDN3636302.1 helix-turn-helix transcriptional regulator [Neolewinella lacunae]